MAWKLPVAPEAQAVTTKEKSGHCQRSDSPGPRAPVVSRPNKKELSVLEVSASPGEIFMERNTCMFSLRRNLPKSRVSRPLRIFVEQDNPGRNTTSKRKQEVKRLSSRPFIHFVAKRHCTTKGVTYPVLFLVLEKTLVHLLPDQISVLFASRPANPRSVWAAYSLGLAGGGRWLLNGGWFSSMERGRHLACLIDGGWLGPRLRRWGRGLCLPDVLGA